MGVVHEAVSVPAPVMRVVQSLPVLASINAIKSFRAFVCCSQRMTWTSLL